MSAEMFIKIGDVKGEARGKGHEDEIDVLSWSWGATQSGTMHVGGGGGSGKVNMQDMSFTKYVDSSSTNLMLKVCNGKHYPEAKLIVRKAGDKPVEYVKEVYTPGYWAWKPTRDCESCDCPAPCPTKPQRQRPCGPMVAGVPTSN